MTLGALALFFRYEAGSGLGGRTIYRFDRWTGEVTLCVPTKSNPLRYKCSGNADDDWVPVPK